MAVGLPDLVPVRMVNEVVYCPRLAYLEWVDSRFVDNADTVEGRWVHRRVDEPRGDLDRPRSTAVTVSSERLGLIGKIDVLEDTGADAVIPVEYKRGRPRSADEPLWEPELVQLCAQVMLLRENGYRVPHAEVYFAETRSRHEIAITSDLEARTLAALKELRRLAVRDEPPPPLVDSPKCPRCSLVGICLPDEVNLLAERAERPPRRLVAGDPPATPLYATKPGARLRKRRGRVVLVEDGEEVASRRLIDVSHIAVFGNVDVSSALLRSCFDAGIPVLWMSSGGWFSGVATGMPPKNVAVRMRQHRLAAIGDLTLPRAFVAGKIRNQRTLIRRHARSEAGPVLERLSELARAAEQVSGRDELLGIEGTAARLYFSAFGRLLRGRDGVGGFVLEERNRRPPRDPVNALLSLSYALLAKDTVVALLATGLDPFVGLYHRPRFGRPSLALDLMEEMRPLIADSVVLTAINNGEVGAEDFIQRAGGVALTDRGRARFIACYERRMRTELRHPVFGYRTSCRRALEIQARMIAAVMVGDLARYRSLTTR